MAIDACIELLIHNLDMVEHQSHDPILQLRVDVKFTRLLDCILWRSSEQNHGSSRSNSPPRRSIFCSFSDSYGR